MRHGGGIVAIYNGDLILKSLKSLGYSDKEVRCFANDGCWKVQIPGKTNFSYMPFDALQIFNSVIGITKESIPQYNSVEEIYSAFRDSLRDKIETLYREQVANAYVLKTACGRKTEKSSLLSSQPFEYDCIEHTRSYHDFGPEYIVRSPHNGGAPDAANSLYAIEKVVFEEKKISFAELVQILKDNWEHNELLRLYVKNNFTYYGNDFDESDA